MKTVKPVLIIFIISLLPFPVQAQNLAPIIAEAVIDAPLKEVWSAWTTGQGLKSWLAPHAEIEMKIGGVMRTNYNPEGKLGDPQTIENEVLSYEPGKMLSTRVKKTPENFPFSSSIRDMWTVLYFREITPNSTEIRVVGLGFSADEESQRMRTFFERGNEVTLQQLKNHFSMQTER